MIVHGGCTEFQHIGLILDKTGRYFTVSRCLGRVDLIAVLYYNNFNIILV